MKDEIYYGILWSGLAAMLVFAPIARGAVRTWSVTPALLVSYALIFIWLWKMNNREDVPSSKLQATNLDKPILAFTVLATVSFIFSIYKHDSFYALIRFFAYLGIYYLVANEFNHSMKKRLIGLIICIGGALSLFGLLQYIGILNHSWWYPPDFLASTYVNHNHFAGYLELVIPVTISMLTARRARLRPALGVVLVLMVAVLILTQSRGAWISLGASLLVMAAAMLKKAMRDKKGIIIFALLIFSVASLLYFGKDVITERLDTVLQITEGKESSSGTRLKIWRGTIDMIEHNPLVGTGIGTFVWGFPRYRPEGLNVLADYAHNDYLQAAAEMGIFALLFIVWILFKVIRKGLKDGPDDPIRLGCAIGALSLSLHGLVDFNFHIPANMLLFTVYLAIVMKKPK